MNLDEEMMRTEKQLNKVQEKLGKLLETSGMM
jgi:hypothetical protein